MKRALLPLLVLVAALVAGAIFWSNKSTTSAPLTPDAGSASHAATGAQIAEPDSALTPDELRARNERSLAASQARHGDGPALDGQILPPPDCGPDDTVEVFALAREADIDELFTAIGPVGSGDNALNNVELSRLVVARTKMDARGTFHLALPTNTRKTHVLFAGRSWFLRESFAVVLKDVTASGLLLQAECGGWVTGRIDLPVAAASRAHELDGQIAVVRPALGGFGPGQRGGFGPGRGGFGRSERRASVTELGFEVRALDPAITYTLELVPATLAATKVDVPEILRGRATTVALPITDGGTISGRTLGPNGEPIAGAKVEARVQGQFFGFDDRVVRTAESRTDGSFQLSAVSPGAVMVDADSKDLVAADPKKLDVQNGASTSGVDLVLGAGESVAGVVTWKDGGPAVGATVTANADRGRNFGGPGGRGPQRGEDPTATTDDQGRFVLRGLSGSTFTVNAEALTAADAASSAQSTPATKRKLAWRARASGVKAAATDVALALEAPIVVRGTVLSVEGAPVQHFNVRAQPGGRNGGGGAFQGFGGGGGGGGGRNSEDVDDERGEFVLGGLREGTWRVEITADGFAPPDAIEVELPQKPTDPAPVFHLVRAAVVTGTVMSPSGAPVANATVTQAATGGDAPWMRGGNNPSADVRARTDGNGRFKIDGLKNGRMVLVAESKDWARSNEVGVDLVSGATSADVVLTMHVGGRITGEVYDEGRPAVGRTVNATQMATFTNLSARTDGRGAFVFEHVEAGSWRIVALPSADDMASAASDGGGGRGNMFSRMKNASADVVDGQEAHVVIGAAPSDPVKVSGKVTQGGEGVVGARVMFLLSGQPIGPGSKNVSTGADGTYSIQLDAPGDYSVTVQAQGGNNRGGGGMNMVEFVETIRSGAAVTIDLALPSARISGLVRTPDGDPAARVRVLLESATQTVGGSMMGGGYSDVTTDGDGAFDIQTLRAGKYVLTIGGARTAFRGGGGGPPSGDAQYGRATLDVQLAESEWRRDVDVRLPKAASVGVDVVDEGGNKIPNASVFARDASGRTVDRLSTVRTDAEGHATYNGLSAGRYTFSARKETSVSGESAAVQVSEGDSSSVRVTLAVGTLLYVTTQSSEGAALPAQVSVVDAAGHDMAGMMTFQDLTNRFQRGGPGSNEQKIGPLSPGKYRVHAATNDGKSTDKSVTLSGEPESRITLTISG